MPLTLLRRYFRCVADRRVLAGRRDGREAAGRSQYGDPMALIADGAADGPETELRLWFDDHVDADEVRLGTDFELGADPRFHRCGDGWALTIPRPDIQRLEYKIEVNQGGDWAHLIDPLNVRTVPNPFGDKSELLFRDYRPPEWLSAAPGGTTRPFASPHRPLGESIPGTLWSPEGLADGDPAPLLLVHDGSDFAERGSLLRWAGPALRPARLLLLDPAPGRRDDWYAANPDYTDQLAVAVLPLVHDTVATTAIFGWGASLGALAMLYLHRRYPERAGRIDPAIRLVLHPRTRPAGVRLRRCSTASARRWPRCEPDRATARTRFRC